MKSKIIKQTKQYIQNNKHIAAKSKGILLTVVAVVALITLFFYPTIFSLNEIFLSQEPKVLKSYYEAEYHVQYDSLYFRTTAMNYPYSEFILFTDNQGLITNAIKFIDQYIYPIADYTTGIIHVLLFSSIILSAIFLFLLFHRLKIPVWYATVFAILITFLSPQIRQFNAQLSLSYVFIIPFCICLLYKFHQSFTFFLSAVLGICFLLFISLDFYYFGFALVIMIVYWIYILITQKAKRKFLVFVPHILIQLVLPAAAIRFIFYYNNSVTDRAIHAWEHAVNHTYPQAVFLPLGTSYGDIITRITALKPVAWEQHSFIGWLAVIGLAVIIIRIIVRLFKQQGKQAFSITRNTVLDVLFWASIVNLIYCFSVNFIHEIEFFLDRFALMRPMRGIARYPWVFFYVINIIVVYELIRWQPAKKWSFIRYIAIVLSILVTAFDTWINTNQVQSCFIRRDVLIAEILQQPENKQAIKNIEPENFQAIIPVPYFHIGSENFYLAPKCGIAQLSSYISAATGLPTTATFFHYTSIGQSFRNLQLFYEPYRKLAVVDDYPCKKPFLIVVPACNQINDVEENLLELAKNDSIILQSKSLQIYRLSFSILHHLTDSLLHHVKKEINTRNLFLFGDALCTDSSKTFVYEDFYGNLSNHAYMGVDAYEGVMRDTNTVFFNTIPKYRTKTIYNASFWFKGITRDLFPRTIVEFTYTDSLSRPYKTERYLAGELFRTIDGDWALIQYRFQLLHPKDKLRISLWNKELGESRLVIDELLIRRETTDIYIKLLDYIGKNNRFYQNK